MILIGLGANLPSPLHGSPKETLGAALGLIEDMGVRVLARSRWYSSAPETTTGGVDDAWYTNGVAVLETDLEAVAILDLLMEVERRLGRVRVVKNESRVVDLDLLAHGDLVVDRPPKIVIPHPRMHRRSFVLLPLAEVAPGWKHPKTGATVEELIAALPSGGLATKM
ncbi:MAG: 2-amino-4-hydroxy-6-hydroxymethyldihydropteridine diphosphokinase [Alphaproteobacteria bacterium]|nr:2-amino-4-hydroxy-6-hydroxymethyldihydropteridine diphosphokinase [Alphaproteobacteria bacterium]MBT4711803.1 2-amino-4-hydroxy-6-hydroxymethyldihydropteridine diphosphokinase [Alphaproteobacteria bacterium]MBT5859901.1 2-amino-4-hydroxy-6-hydroxymethyldihydropteridine diphosphokinase [Alphaproteobacteria bacterium]